MDATVTIPGSRDESPSEASLLELPERFEVRGKLGEGAMGTVYRALDRRSGREVAIKVLRHRADPRHQERFLREAQTVAALSHPNVVTVYELDPAGRFLVLELAACTLADEVRERGPLDATRTRRLAAEVLSALVRCHAEGVVHRDIKPSNILLAEDGSARLADFGVAHIAQSDLTQTGEVMGTPIYMAPEQLRGVADAQVDVFGLGAVLYESLTGQPPSEVDPRTIRRTLVKRCGDRNLADAVAQALALDRSHRHPSAAHFARALEPRRAHRRAIAAAVLVGAAALFVLALRADESSSESGSDAEVTSAAARVERPVVALLPFDDRREDGNQHFAASGVPHIVGIELRRADLRTVGYYQLLDRVDDAASPEAWESTARQLGATVAVDGTLSADGDAVRVRMRARVLDGSASAPHSWERTVPTQDVGRGVRELAEALSIWLGSEGQPPALDVSHPEDYALGEGIAALGRHDLASAQAHLERAHELAPTDAEIAYQLAIVGWWRGACSRMCTPPPRGRSTS